MVIFSDGFESGDLSAWTGTVQNGATIAASNALAHTGSWSAVTAGLQGAGEYALVTKTVSSASELYMRWYCRFNTTVPTGAYVALGLFWTGSAYTGVFLLDKANNKWGAYNVHTSTFYWEAGTSTINADTWYCLELRCVRHATTGILQTWVDGVAKINQSGLDTGDNNLTRGDIGGYLYGAMAAERIINVDCAVIDNAYVGPESAGVTVKKGGNLSATMTQMLNSKMLYSACKPYASRFPKLAPRMF